MRIVEQRPDRLVLEIRPVALMVMCVGLFLLFFVLGFGMRLIVPMIAGVMGMGDMPGLSNLPHVPGINALGYASVIPLLVAVFLIKTRRLTLDRAAGQITLASRGVLGRSEKSYPLAEFRGASLAASRSGNSGTSYRAVLHIGDETVQVTPYGTSGRGPARIVEAINDWLGPRVSGPSELTGDQVAALSVALERLGVKRPG
jgi:hypothetical protein